MWNIAAYMVVVVVVVGCLCMFVCACVQCLFVCCAGSIHSASV